MKEVITGKNLREIITYATNMMCDCVSSTLGPSGNNVLINKDDYCPFITNDGVTIAESISSDDIKIDTVLEILKEASLKTNELVGDGTTTTLVLLQNILNESYKEIDNGKNPIILKKELDQELNRLLLILDSFKKDPSENDLKNIASISSNSEEIGSLVSEVFKKANNKYSIKLTESNTSETYYEIKKGYSLEIDCPSLYFENDKQIFLKDVNFLLLTGYLSSLESISEIINEGFSKNKNIVILCEDFDDNVLNEVILYKLENDLNIYLFKVLDYGMVKDSTYEDLVLLSNSNVKNINFEKINYKDIGKFKEIEIKKDEIVFISDVNTSDKVKDLEKELKETYNDYDKELLSNRISKLSNGIATIFVGAPTKTEIKEKIMRFEDAICAADIAKDGIVCGEGITFLKLIDFTDNIIFKNSLSKPFDKIMENSGIDLDIKNEIIDSNYTKVYNIQSNTFEDISSSNIIDPYKVIVTALTNAVSIATMLFTINYLVINETIKEKRLEI